MDEDKLQEFIEDRAYDLMEDFLNQPINADIRDEFYRFCELEFNDYLQMRAEDAIDNAIEQDWLDKHSDK